MNEIVAQADSPLTQFTAACLATKILAMHLLARREGRWSSLQNEPVTAAQSSYFQNFEGTEFSADS